MAARASPTRNVRLQITCPNFAARARRTEWQRRWTDEELLAVLRELQARQGGVLQRRALRKQQLGPDAPCDETVVGRFGSWRRICELLGQPYRMGREKGVPIASSRQWTDEAILAALRELRARCGGRLQARDLGLELSGHKGRAGRYPTYATVRSHFGTWAEMLRRLDAPTPPSSAAE